MLGIDRHQDTRLIGWSGGWFPGWRRGWRRGWRGLPWFRHFRRRELSRIGTAWRTRTRIHRTIIGELADDGQNHQGDEGEFIPQAHDGGAAPPAGLAGDRRGVDHGHRKLDRGDQNGGADFAVFDPVFQPLEQHIADAVCQ